MKGIAYRSAHDVHKVLLINDETIAGVFAAASESNSSWHRWQVQVDYKSIKVKKYNIKLDSPPVSMGSTCFS